MNRFYRSVMLTQLLLIAGLCVFASYAYRRSEELRQCMMPLLLSSSTQAQPEEPPEGEEASPPEETTPEAKRPEKFRVFSCKILLSYKEAKTDEYAVDQVKKMEALLNAIPEIDEAKVVIVQGAWVDDDNKVHYSEVYRGKE
jgi:hypothetical protein